MTFDARADLAVANQNSGVEQNHNSLVGQCWEFLKEHKAASGIVAAGAVAGIALLTHKFAFAEKAAAIAEDTLGTAGRELGATARTSEAVQLIGKAGSTASSELSIFGASRPPCSIDLGAEMENVENPKFGLVSLGGPVNKEYLAWLRTSFPEMTPLTQSAELGETLTDAEFASLSLKSPELKVMPISTPAQFDYALTRAFEPGAVRIPSRSIGM
jgi:hypothetical protein